MDHGFPADGTYSGTGITAGVFDASVAGIGTHAVRYIFENACAADTAYDSITVIASPTVSASITNVSCNGLTDGQLTTNTAGGNGPYTFSWSNGDTLPTTDSLAAGTYTVTASGDGGCVVSNNFNVTEPAILALALDSLDDVVCNGFGDGKAFVSTSGGTAAYTYAWSNGTATEDALNLQVGTHSLTVTDANGCQDSLSVTISEVNPIALSSSKTDITCYGLDDGTASTIAIGGGGIYTYAWSGGAATSTANGLSSGETHLTVTDQNGCVAMDTVDIAEPDSLIMSIGSENLTCYESNDGSASATVSGGRTPYAYLWSNSVTIDSIQSLIASTYAITVTDSSGCVKIDSAVVTQPDSISIVLSVTQNILCFGDSNGAINSTVSGGTTPYSFSWTGGAGDSLTMVSAGTYTLTVTDTNGCNTNKSIALNEPAALVLTLDSLNDLSCFESADGAIFTGHIGWNRNGCPQLVFGANNG